MEFKVLPFLFSKLNNKHYILKKIKIILELFKNLLKGIFIKSEISLEEWEHMERKYSPHSSHHGQIYYRENNKTRIQNDCNIYNRF